MQPPKFSHKKLSALLAEPELIGQGMSPWAIHGFILAVVSAPELIMPSDWFPVLWEDEEGPEFRDDEQFQALHGQLMALWNETAKAVQSPRGIAYPNRLSLG